MSLVYGFRDKKPNMRRIWNDLSGERSSDLDDFQEMLEESNARVDPEARKKQLEFKQALEKNQEN